MSVPKHGGNLTHLSRTSGIARDKIIDFSANINPLGLPEWFRPLVSSALESVAHYPDPENAGLISAVSKRYGITSDEAIVGNGSTEILHLLTRVVKVNRAIIPVPAYSDYAQAAANAGLEILKFRLQESDDFILNFKSLESALHGNEIVFLCNPNNPTGNLLDPAEIRRLAMANPSSTFVIDEAFGDFVENYKSLTKDRPKNVVVLLSLTKIFAIPGLRLGAAVADPSIVEAVRELQPSWSVNTIAHAVGEAALNDSEYVKLSRDFVALRRSELQGQLESLPGLKNYRAAANFLFLRIDRNDLDASELARRTLEDGIAIRVCANFDGLDGRFFRVAVRTAEENEQLVEALKKALGLSRKPRKPRKKPALMFQGTSSNVGKSVLTAAMCRIFLQDGYRVAPFKSQNMSLNSFVTRNGGEMGRAQVVQAQASRLEPDVRMNPILLKPNTDTGSQVIVSGKPVGNMDVMEYVNYKPVAFKAAKESYDSLSAEFDVIVLEGAGSPGEVNLKHHDIVNMQMAKYSDAPVILVGDIDRGGVFASFVGTMEVLAEWERALVAGFLVNKFRGKEDLLQDAMDYTLKHTRRPVLGIVPYLHNLGLPEEDSVTFKTGIFPHSSPSDDFVEIAVIDLPHISNFTDFDAFRIEPDVSLKVIRKANELNQPDAVILPGSKNVIGDLQYLKDNGIAAKIRELIASRTEVIGICGGFQMIGSGIADPHYLESDGKTITGLGFLDITTVLALEKTLTRTVGVHLESGLSVHGYEIHHGQSECRGTEPFVRQENGLLEGAKSTHGNVWGTYLHGIFDADEFRRWFIDRLRSRKGLEPKRSVCAAYDLEPALERLAETVHQKRQDGRVLPIDGTLMRLEYQILIAVALDFFTGDPRTIPHPVQAIARLAMWLEEAVRSAIRNVRLAGVVVAFSVIAFTGLITWGIIRVSYELSPFVGDVISMLFLCFGIAARGMIQHSEKVYSALAAGSLEEARHNVSMICGRDTDTLDETGVIKATVESVAENMVDAVTAPLFYAVIGGPVGIMVYKAINTLDSTFGYKNEKYLEFGWASAKLDDAANIIPARLTGLLVPLAAIILRQKCLQSLLIFIRDRKKHPSPNAGHTEAAVAGALGIQLGGLSYYGGKPSNKPTLGDPILPVESNQILAANRLLWVTSGLALAIFMTARLIVLGHIV